MDRHQCYNKDNMSSLTIVSNRLPVTVKKVDDELVFESSSGGLATAMSGIEAETVTWIGWPGIASDDLTAAERAKITRELKKHHCLPVFLSQSDIELFYEGYANNTLWPLFHYFQNLPQYRNDYWQAYKSVNQRFTKATLRHASSADTIWIQDYQLMLAPQLLRATLPNASIGFFLHIPFPSYELFRHLPERKQILEGLLGANLIGFHTYDYARHFLSSCLRILGYSSTNGKLQHKGRSVSVDAFPIGINYHGFQSALASPAVKDQLVELRQHYKGQKLILSVDRLDYTKGILERLEAFQQFLANNPAYHKKVSLVMIAVPSRTEVEEYRHLRDEVEQAVGRINGMYGSVDWMPISYQFQAIPFDHLVALYSRADVALVTPLRDGMNLVAKEFVACQNENPGVLILSEMAGAYEELAEADGVNPYDVDHVAKVIHGALRLPKRERQKRIDLMKRRIKLYNAEEWSRDFLQQLTVAVDSTADTMIDEKMKKSIVQHYIQAQQRLIILDYDGTLRAFVGSPDPRAARPSPRLMKLLKRLSRRSDTTVMIISGRTKEALEEWFGDTSIELAAEHGAWQKKHTTWQSVDSTFETHRKEIVVLMNRYAARTPGAVVEQKDFAVVWHYRNVPPELAYVRAANLKHELKSLLDQTDIDTHSGNKVIEVKPNRISKGSVSMERIQSHPYDFVLIAGDDYTDETMFAAAPQHAYTIKVGEGSTSAAYRIDNVDSMVDFLERLSQQ